jgi:hypothetical protein
MMKIRLGLVLVLAVSLFVEPGHSADTPPAAKLARGANESIAITALPAEATPEKQLFKGKVVKVAEALKRRGVKAYPEELKNQVALETATELIPILPDWRGRAFYQDERLRDRDVELIGFRRKGLPYLNVLSVYTFDVRGRRQYTDYWCDICSIPMYEIKPCDCCQQEIRLRFEPQDLPEDVKPADQPETVSR